MRVVCWSVGYAPSGLTYPTLNMILAFLASESFDFREHEFAAVHVHAAELGAAVQGRYRLAGIEQAVRIECRLDGMELREFGRIELHAHLVDLLHAHAVLAGDGAADLDAQFENLAAEFLGALQLTRFVGIVKNQRM